MSPLYEKLRRALEEHLDTDLLSLLPRRVPIIGDVALLRLHPRLCPHAKLIGQVLLALIPRLKAVWVFKERTRGVWREPRLEHVAGDPDPVVVHRELNTYFKLDISRLTFSPGNAGEREWLARNVRGTVVDLFACVGNLSMPLAVRGCRVIAVEINPLAYRYLLETIKLNHVEDRVLALNIDNHYFTGRDIADHVLLGFLPEPDLEQLAVGLRSLKSRGGWIHYHVAVRRDQRDEKLEEILGEISSMGYSIKRFTMRKVKGVAPNVDHIVIRVFCRRQ